MADKYVLMVSHDAGTTYHTEIEVDNLDDPKLLARCEQLDKEWLRWCIEQNGQQVAGPICRIHRGLIDAMVRLRGEEGAH